VIYGERAKNTVAGKGLAEMDSVQVDALCYLVLIVSQATTRALALDETLEQRYPDIPWRQIRGTGNRLRHGFATIDHQFVHEIVENGHLDQLLGFARAELDRRGP
jgi:uncharacterized protein with HEPN domain